MCLFFSLYFLCSNKVEVVRELSGSVRVLEKPGGKKNMYSVFDDFFRADVHFKSKPRKVVGKGVIPF